MKPAWALGALGGLILALLVLAGCGGSGSSPESKREHCQGLINQEHSECVAELRKEDSRSVANGGSAEPTSQQATRPAGIGLCQKLDNLVEIEACEAGYRRGLATEAGATAGEKVEILSSACEGYMSSPNYKAMSDCTVGFELAHGERKRWAEVISPANEGLENVGTIAISNHKGTAFVDHYKIGRPIYPDEAMPPEEVLVACNLSYQSVLQKSVFAPGEISVSYTEGSFPELMGIDAESTIQGNGPGMEVVAYQKDGEWLCRQEELASTSYEIQPGETWNLPIWFIAEEALSNAQPRVSEETKNEWHFRFVGPNMYGTWKYSGPGAGECGGYEELYLYNRSGTTYC